MVVVNFSNGVVVMPASPNCQLHRLTAALATATLLCGCHAVSSPLPQSAAAGQASTQVVQRLMIRLKGADTPCTQKDIVTLADATSQTLEYVRPMSGEACVVSHVAANDAALSVGLQRIREHPSVELADIDKIVTIR